MIKNRLLVLLLVISNGTYAQNDIESQFKSLQINSSPAYVILGIEPENIQRPNSPQDFVANVQSAIVNDKLQPNFALETSPYYWNKPKDGSKKFNVVDYLYNNDYAENLAKSITFSMATSPSDSFTFGSIPVGTGLGIGMHIQLFQGRLSPRIKENLMLWFNGSRTQNLLTQTIQHLTDGDNRIDDLEEWLDKLLAFNTYKNVPANNKTAMKDFIINHLGSSLTKDDIPRIKKLRDKMESQSQKGLNNVNKYVFPLTREGFIMELSVADAAIAEQSRWDKLTNAKTAIWLTPSYRFNVNKDPTIIDIIDIMAVMRLTFNNRDVDSSDYFDGGLKLQWIHNRLSFSGEAVLRYLTQIPVGQSKSYTWRSDVTLSYKINDFVTFKATFGSNFDGNSVHYSDPKKMFAVGGFNFGFSNFLKQTNN